MRFCATRSCGTRLKPSDADKGRQGPKQKAHQSAFCNNRGEVGAGPGCERSAAASYLASRKSHPAKPPPATAPTICAAMKPGMFEGAIPENVSVKARAKVTAGLAKEVDAVNQYAEVM